MSDQHPAWQTKPPDTRIQAFGYVRAEDPADDQIPALRAEIAAFCRAEDLRLVTIFCDRGSDGSELARPGFAGLLDALAVTRDVRLVIPDSNHLSPYEAVREGLLRQVRRTGARLLVTREVNGKLDDTGVAEASTSIGDEPNGGRS
jgi:hypothetical protein